MQLPVPAPEPPPWRAAVYGIVGTFLSGLLFLLPFILTLLVFEWLLRAIASFFGPDTLIGSAMTSGGVLLTGDATLGFWLLLLLVLLGIWAVGLWFQNRATRRTERKLDRIMDRIPGIGSVYRPIAQLVRMLDPAKGGELKAMRAVAVSFGGNVDTLALQVSSDIFQIGGMDRLLILIPTAPVPMGGALLFFAPDAVRPVEGLGVEELMKFYVSMGAMNPGLPHTRPDIAAA